MPKVGELCCFYKHNSHKPVFARFKRFLKSNIAKYEVEGYTPNGTELCDKNEFGYFERCVSFTGNLPKELYVL